MTFQPTQGGGVGAQTRQDAVVQGAFLTQAFFWMFAGLMLSAIVATLVQFVPNVRAMSPVVYLALFIGQLGLVLFIQAAIGRLSPSAALGLFFVFAATMGITLGVIVSFYTGTSVATAFLSAGSMFGAAALYGYTTKRSLATIGAYASMAVWGLLVAILVNVFLGSSPIGYLISIAGVVLFTVLTAWDVQRISSGQLVATLGSVEKAAVIGALHLYLDFVNLFLFLLRLLGGRR